ncbi:hypothetical protein DQ04_07001040 [Trypanosoma grayi]|uniref:hypothetical protein n=1 Tax=Trypanosoma grayi TaxID=71804 RepID=UPI0004F4BB7C|nr:hypothetical protein DQ04_07001040 [Trypanosoma grayi]KEG08519.1 hypothetical protein DQ04_07001040 [Trypanosoma grayi]
MLDVAETDEGEALTGAELFHYIATRNEQQLAENRRKVKEYTQLQEVLQNLTDRCRLSILAPVAGGMAYFEATMDYTNNILVLLGDSWFAERSAKQAREIAGRRLDFLCREEAALLAEASALQQRQSLFLSEIPNAERAMAEVEAAKAGAFHGCSEKGEGSAAPTTTTTTITNATVGAGAPPMGKEGPLQLGLEDQDLAVIDELDQLTEDELLQIEEELGDKIEDDELVERIITERIIAKKEKRVREQLQKSKVRVVPLATGAEAPPQNIQEQQQQRQQQQDLSFTSAPPKFNAPGDIGRAAAAVVSETVGVDSTESGAAKKSKRRITFSDVVDVVPPEGPVTAMSAPLRGGDVQLSSGNVLGEVVEHAAMSSPHPIPVAAAAPKRKSLFRTELEGGK